MIELPVTSSKPNNDILKSLLIISHMKCGKTSNALQIPDSLLIDVGDSAEYYGGRFLNVKALCKKEGKGPVTILREIVDSIKQKNKEVKGYAYRRIIIDELTSLEEIATAYATWKYKQTPQGESYKGNDITELDFGKGYGLLREAMDELINPFRDLCETLVLLGHTKTSAMIKNGESVQYTDLNATGKLKVSLPANTDANAIMHRDKDGKKNILTFKNRGNDMLTGSRIERLRNQEFVISELDEKGNLITYWDKVFSN
jgi:hypothetical protein